MRSPETPNAKVIRSDTRPASSVSLSIAICMVLVMGRAEHCANHSKIELIAPAFVGVKVFGIPVPGETGAGAEGVLTMPPADCEKGRFAPPPLNPWLLGWNPAWGETGTPPGGQPVRPFQPLPFQLITDL